LFLRGDDSVRRFSTRGAFMNAVVNHLQINPDADWGEIAQKFDAFAKDVRGRFPAMTTAVLTRMSENEAVFIGIYEDPETMRKVSSEVAAPWFTENMRQYLSGQTHRKAGEVIAGSSN
jgi:hypothetical protein